MRHIYVIVGTIGNIAPPCNNLDDDRTPPELPKFTLKKYQGECEHAVHPKEYYKMHPKKVSKRNK